MQTKKPREQKSLGRKVSNFKEDVWTDSCKNIVKEGNMAKVPCKIAYLTHFPEIPLCKGFLCLLLTSFMDHSLIIPEIIDLEFHHCPGVLTEIRVPRSECPRVCGGGGGGVGGRGWNGGTLLV